MTITEVRSNGWNMKGEFGRFGGCWAGESGEDEPADVFLQLPPGVAAKGKTGAPSPETTISSLRMACTTVPLSEQRHSRTSRAAHGSTSQSRLPVPRLP